MSCPTPPRACAAPADARPAAAARPANPASGWLRSSYCADHLPSCVEVAFGPTGVFVRDSKDPDGPVLAFTQDEWTAFLLGAQAGEFEFRCAC
ncbi:MAG: DUF397 domain-containing protein [Frankia sp.]|nr:DUF397 domain-containing protein [Frankia sp.]